MVLIYIFIFLATCFIPTSRAHTALGPVFKDGYEPDCDSLPPPQSYHIHIIFYGTNTNSTNDADALKKQFAEEFDVTEDCPISPADLGINQKTICAFATEYEPVGPFLTAQWSFFIPKIIHEEVMSFFNKPVQWTMQNRRNFDAFIHPNTGCSTRDHVDWSLWGGNKWALDTSKLHS